MDKLFSVAKFAAMDAQTQEKYLAQIMWEWDQESQIYTGYMDGMEKGLADGRAKGLKEGRAKGRAKGRAEGMARIIDTAKAMKQVLIFPGKLQAQVLLVTGINALLS
ncbi:MAG: hypothetical protein MJY96_06365 [Bacteroidaceae bacterium]|nr:hypothetical protein [Bacteroidaceae bacterium]